MQLSPQEAASALGEIEAARAAMRRTIRAHRGHFHLWIWGVVWVAMPLTAHFGGDHRARFFPWICIAGGIASAVVGLIGSAIASTPAGFPSTPT